MEGGAEGKGGRGEQKGKPETAFVGGRGVDGRRTVCHAQVQIPVTNVTHGTQDRYTREKDGFKQK